MKFWGHLILRQIPVDDDAMKLEEMLSDEADLTVDVQCAVSSTTYALFKILHYSFYSK